MKQKKQVIRQDAFAQSCASITSNVISFFLLILVFVFPLFLHNSYFDILETKYSFFYISVLAMTGILLVSGIIMARIDLKEYQGVHIKKMFAALAPKNWRSTFSIADIAIIIFWAVSVISTLQSEYLYEAFWGNEGRYSGLFLMTLYVLLYFLVSRFWKFKGWILEAFLCASLPVSFLGITDYFQMDIMHFRVNVNPYQLTIFTSTLGNINTYTAYIALVIGLTTAMYATTRNKAKIIWYYFCMVVSFFAIITGNSDNAYLALGALFAFLPLFIFRSKEGILRYFIIIATFATTIQCIDWLNQAYAGVVIGVDSLFKVLVNLPGLSFIIAALWILAGLIWLLLYKNEHLKDKEALISKYLIRTWTGLLIAAFLLLCFLLIDANMLGHGDRYGSLSSYLVFNDQWGTKRGYVWRKTLEIYGKFPFIHKLFGYGPDTFGILTTQNYMEEMVNTTGFIFDTVHNEYLQFLITIGPIALAAYLVFLISSGIDTAKYLKKSVALHPQSSLNTYSIGCMFAIICYCFQAFVNLNLPITAPLMWILASVGVSAIRTKEID